MNMYFKNRDQAGRQLAEELFHPYGRSATVIIAVGPGGLLVARPMALRLQVPLFMIATREIDLPGSDHQRIGTLDQAGVFSYNSDMTTGQVNDFVGEYHNHIEAQKIEAMHEINLMLGAQGFVERRSLHEKNIILVSDGLKSMVELDAIMVFLKPVKHNRMIGATPVASIDAVDRLHIITDEVRVLSTKENYLDTNHYYEENELPSTDQAQQIINELHQAGLA